MAEGSTAVTEDAPPPADTSIPDLLLLWLSPGFPVGAFAFSHGLEKLVDDRVITNRPELEGWLGDLATLGSLRTDLILLAEAWRAASAASHADLASVSELALALQPSSERRLEAVTQGTAFFTAVRAAWPAAGLSLHGGDEIAYPVAVGLCAAAHRLSLVETLRGYALAFVQNLVSAAIRLGVIGQTDGQRIIAALMPVCREAARLSSVCRVADIGSATFATDLASLRHETQYSRLFRS